MVNPNSWLTIRRRRVRAENSLLLSAWLNEQVAWTGGEEKDPPISFGELVSVSAGESRLPSLARVLNLPPDEEDSDVATLNKIFRHIGVSCTGFMSFSPLIHPVTLYALTDPIPGDSTIGDQLPADALQPRMNPAEVPLYIFLAYLTMFVYSSIVL